MNKRTEAEMERDFWRAKAEELQMSLAKEIAAHKALRESLAKEIADRNLDAAIAAAEEFGQ